MPCSRYFHPDELPEALTIDIVDPFVDFAICAPRGLTKEQRRMRDEGKFRYARTVIWFVARNRWGEIIVDQQRLVRGKNETHWGANDINPRWPDRIEGTEWYATEEEAKAAHAKYTLIHGASGHEAGRPATQGDGRRAP
jgi:hypothetical protein